MIVAMSLRQGTNQHGQAVDILEHAYVSYFETLGFHLRIIPNMTKNVPMYCRGVEGIILTGGNDVDPLRYGEEREGSLSLAPERDKVEEQLVAFAVKQKLPLLAICRGMQYLNVLLGGKVSRQSHPLGNHKVLIRGETTQAYCGKDAVVNSFHNHSIPLSFLSAGLVSFAETPDGVVEGYVHRSLPFIGIQWHPERESPDETFNRKIVDCFVQRKSLL